MGKTSQGETEKADDYLTRLLKYIPAESVALWIALYGIVTGASSEIPIDIVTWLIFIALAILTPLYLWRIAKVTSEMQIAISFTQYAIRTRQYYFYVLTLGNKEISV